MHHSLRIKGIQKETSESVSIEFEVPSDLIEEFSFKSGQFLTLKHTVNGEELRRSYSLCSTPKSGKLKVVVKQIQNGKFSTFANTKLKTGDHIELGKPAGNFFVETNKQNQKSYTLIAAGSGITPIISILKTILNDEPNSTVNLFYGNKSPELTIFKNKIDELITQFNNNLNVHYIYSKTKGESRFHSGRLEGRKLKKLFKKFAPAHSCDEIFICGPQEMTLSIIDLLENKFNFNSSKIHYELFTAKTTEKSVPFKKSKGSSSATATLNGETIEFVVKKNESILEAGLSAGHDIPFSCQGGVCGVCKCFIGDGKVEMENNIALSDDEVSSGAVLSCQAKVLSPSIKISFDY